MYPPQALSLLLSLDLVSERQYLLRQLRCKRGAAVPVGVDLRSELRQGAHEIVPRGFRRKALGAKA